MNYLLFILLTGLLLAMAFAGTSHNLCLTVINDSMVPLTDLQLLGHGFTRCIGTLAPGAELRIEVEPLSETPLTLSFAANGKPFSAPASELEAHGPLSITALIGAEQSAQPIPHAATRAKQRQLGSPEKSAQTDDCNAFAQFKFRTAPLPLSMPFMTALR